MVSLLLSVCVYARVHLSFSVSVEHITNHCHLCPAQGLRLEKFWDGVGGVLCLAGYTEAWCLCYLSGSPPTPTPTALGR